jgi:hypothetical protein
MLWLVIGILGSFLGGLGLVVIVIFNMAHGAADKEYTKVKWAEPAYNPNGLPYNSYGINPRFEK